MKKIEIMERCSLQTMKESRRQHYQVERSAMTEMLHAT